MDSEDVRRMGGIDLPTLQKYLNMWYSSSLDLFGGEKSSNAAQFFADGLKGRFMEEKYDDHLCLEGSYRLPVMHTETNLWEGPHGDEAVKWLWKEWANVLRLRNVGIPTVGFTWYSLTDQVDWDTALREQNGNVNPLGLFDLDRKIRNVGKAYKQLIADWRNVLPAQSVCLIVPIKKLSDHPDDDDAAGVAGLHVIADVDLPQADSLFAKVGAV